MDCCICSPFASIYRPPRNAICSSCFEGSRSMIAFLNLLDEDRDPIDSATTISDGFKANSLKGLYNAFNRVKQMREREEEMNERICFLAGFVDGLRDGMHTDIVVKPRSGAPIPAHRALLASRSEVFRNMLCSDECKAPAEDTISFPELGHDELHCLLEFLYTGSLPHWSTEQQRHSLLIAADKYDIPFLRKVIERRILDSLDSSNALDVLEVSEICSNRELKEQAMNSILENAENVVFSPRYDDFAAKNAHLCVQITRALLSKMKDQKVESSQNEPMAP